MDNTQTGLRARAGEKAVSAIDKEYGDFYAKRNAQKVYPVEFVVRTLLGRYPRLRIERSGFRGGNALDLGCGDGRHAAAARPRAGGTRRGDHRSDLRADPRADGGARGARWVQGESSIASGYCCGRDELIAGCMG